MKPNIILLGPAGSGKSSQTDQLVSSYKYHSIALGSILRKPEFQRTPLGMRTKRFIDAGLLIDDFTANTIIFSQIQATPAGNPFVLDGYPRNASQAIKFKSFLITNKIQIRIIIELRLPDQIASRRIHEHANSHSNAILIQPGAEIGNPRTDLVFLDETDSAIKNRIRLRTH